MIQADGQPTPVLAFLQCAHFPLERCYISIALKKVEMLTFRVDFEASMVVAMWDVQ